MIIDCISDLHGNFPKLEGGDLLIIAGDLTRTHCQDEYLNFINWLDAQKYKKKIVIFGNHDVNFDEKFISCLSNCSYLCDSGTEFQGLKIWGTPRSLWFRQINPNCTAFSGSEAELEKKFDLIPLDTDILISHGPPYMIADQTIDGYHVGSRALRKALFKVKPKVLLCGHIHEAYGTFTDYNSMGDKYYVINCSHVNESYEPVNERIRLVI